MIEFRRALDLPELLGRKSFFLFGPRATGKTWPKFYLFDVGVWHTLTGTRTLDRNSDLYARSFETWLLLEVRAFLNVRRIREPIAYWRSVHGQEVDIVVGDRLAIETKATRRVGRSDLRGLRALGEEGIVPHRLLVSQDPVEAVVDGILCLPWTTFLTRIWRGDWLDRG